MKKRFDPLTYRHPRNLVQAFGPYAHDSQIAEPVDPMPKEDRAVIIVCAIAALALVAMFAAGWIR
jgi:hypothetical protein